MARQYLRQAAPNTQQAGETSIFRHDIGWVYYYLDLFYSTLADLDEIRIKLGNDIYQRYKVADLIKFNTHDGLPAPAATNGCLRIPLAGRGMKREADENDTAIVTGAVSKATGRKISQFHTEVDIKATAVNPSISMSASLAPAPKEVPALVVHYIRRELIQISAAGEFEHVVQDAGQDKTQILQRAFLLSADLDEVEIKADRTTIFERSKAENDQVLANSGGGKVPQAGVIVFDPEEDGYAEAPSMVGVQNLYYKLENTAATDVALYNHWVGSY